MAPRTTHLAGASCALSRASGGSHYVEGNYGSVWDFVDGGVYPAEPGRLRDPSGQRRRFEWPITVPADAIVSRSLVTFSADMTPPETTIDSGPSGLTNDPTPSFTFSSSAAGSSFECKIDTGAFSPCSSPKTACASR